LLCHRFRWGAASPIPEAGKSPCWDIPVSTNRTDYCRSACATHWDWTQGRLRRTMGWQSEGAVAWLQLACLCRLNHSQSAAQSSPIIESVACSETWRHRAPADAQGQTVRAEPPFLTAVPPGAWSAGVPPTVAQQRRAHEKVPGLDGTAA
jgi:hypothetical protein